MEDPEFWRWVWLMTAVVFLIGEMLNPGSFFLAPFAIGAGLAALLAFLGVDVAWTWLAFLVVSGGAALALRPLARRLDEEGGSDGIGARRLIGTSGSVIEPIAPTGHGMVRIDREEWRAESADGVAMAPGTPVEVVEVHGTRVLVRPT